MARQTPGSKPSHESVDAVVVGAGFAGLYALKRLRDLGLSIIGIESGDDVGGTWHWNRYPGVRCDAPSLFYCYSFSDELRLDWTWSERYPTGAEIHAYLRHVAERFGLYDHIRLSSTVASAVYDDDTARWLVTTTAGDTVDAKYCILGLGCLSDVLVPDFPGMDVFAGSTYHTARWPESPPNFASNSVGVIGTGSSGSQVIPALATDARRLVVFQRTANYVLPARNAPLDPAYVQSVNADYAALRSVAKCSPGGDATPSTLGRAADFTPEEREAVFEERWAIGGITEFLSCFSDTRSDPEMNAVASDFIRRKIRAAVPDPATAELLVPRINLGEKRPQLSDGYYETYNRDNVELVDVSSTELEVVAEGVRVGETVYPLDSLVFATGFDAMTGSYLRIDVRGRGGHTLRDHWQDGPQTYLGIASAGFPNLFILAGPGSPSVLGNVVVAIEQHVEWIADLLGVAEARGTRTIEATDEAEGAWVRHVNDVGAQTMIAKGNSWYLGSNVPGKPRAFLPYAGGYGRYREICDEAAADDYKGLVLAL